MAVPKVDGQFIADGYLNILMRMEFLGTIRVQV